MMSTDLQWRTTSCPPVDPARFGHDHWSTFAYVETRTVDHRGTIDHDQMRCNSSRHPVMRSAKTGFLAASGDGSRYPTQLAGDEELPGHDDYDCLDDLIAAGLLEVHMPPVVAYNDVEVFLDAYRNPIRDPDEGFLITAEFVTGLTELWLCTQATFALTERGAEVASRLRRHLAAGGSLGSFRLG